MKIGILTINDNNNYGNRLQNYAVQTNILKTIKRDCVAPKNISCSVNRKYYLLKRIKYFIYNKEIYNNNKNRAKNFMRFNENINYSKKFILSINGIKKYDCVIAGSDQIWNPYLERLKDVDLLTFIELNKRIAFSASLGIDTLSTTFNNNYLKKAFNVFKTISVRETNGKNIIESLTGRNDVEVLVDPTLMLTNDEWDKVSKKPKMLRSKKYILNYFLGDLSEEREKEIQRVANENNCEIVELLDESSFFYEYGPCEFLYLEKNAFLICSDLFHLSIFAIIYNRPFFIFDREQKNLAKMNSRIDTLILKLKLKNKKYNGKKIAKENMSHDYSGAYKLLDIEKKKAINFLKNAILGN